jgi:hypothetical protein
MLVFFKVSRPSIEVLLQSVANESNLWCIAGDLALHEFLARSLVLDP